ncbi:MAG: prephenate dehydrogenase [Lachnospiraceae bacterium]|nr:prephenate dehydrogenase [Lachnospiraceae bacterium]
MNNLTLGFIGLGLIGGSIAKAIKENIPAIRITAFDVNEESITLALSEGIVDERANAIDEAFSSCDYIFLCAPVQKNAENLIQIKNIMKSSCILTDVGSVKTDIHKHIVELDMESCFIGGHPMAGSERFGYVNSKASLLENAYYILTPNSKTNEARLAELRALIEKTGAIPLILDYQKHDYITAAISHLPHVIAASLVNLVRDSDSEEGTMKMVAAGGFKDITRIASSSATMWQQICLTNTENISKLLGDYITSLQNIKAQLDARDKDELYQLFDSARIYRDSFANNSSGPIKVSYTINVDITDETGALAAIATLLALKQISIKNMGIVHNREVESGVLKIEFYDEAGMKNASETLRQRGYTIYEKKL